MSDSATSSASAPSATSDELDALVTQALAAMDQANGKQSDGTHQQDAHGKASTSSGQNNSEEDDLDIVIEEDVPELSEEADTSSDASSPSEETSPPSADSDRSTPAEGSPATPPDSTHDDTKAPAQTEAPKQALWKIKKQKYDLIQKYSQLEAENLKLKEALQQSVYEGTVQYAHATQAKLQEAIHAKKKAVEESDTDGQIKADLELITAQKTLHDLQIWLENEKVKTPETKPESSPNTATLPQVSPVHKEMAQDWLDEHPDLQETHPSFNFDKARAVKNFVHDMDQWLTERNYQDLLYTPEYFDNLNAFVKDVDQAMAGNKTSPSKTSAPQPSTSAKPALTTPVPSPVAPVKNTAGTSVPDKKRIVLTRAEKDAADQLGISYKDWIKYNQPS